MPSLTARLKWCRNSYDITEGNLALLMSKNVPRGHWSLAQVTRILRDDERRMHSAEIKIKAGVYVCPVTKLCLLEEVSNL